MIQKFRNSARWTDLNTLIMSNDPIPDIPSDAALLRVESCAICGSDIRTLKFGNSRVMSGQIVGHEISGVIEYVGPRANKKWSVGDRVSVGADVPCGKCIHCRSGRPNCCDINYAIGHQFEGGFTDYMILNGLTLELGPVQKIKDCTSFDEAALAEPLACCINGYEVGRMINGNSVVVFGSGPIGIMLGILARSVYNASSVTLIDPNEDRLKTALHLGAATHILNPKSCNAIDEVLKITNCQGSDMIFTACPVVETHEMAVKMVAKRGVINLFGGVPSNSRPMSFMSNLIHYKEATITGSHGSTPEQHLKALELIESGMVNVKNLVTHIFPLSRIIDAYETAASGEAVKVIVKPAC